MTLPLFAQILAYLSLAFAVLAFGWRLRQFNALARPADRSTPKGIPAAGVRYAFTLGMAPWAKESTRRHPAAYLRGIGFHLGIFLGLALFVAAPGWDRLPQTARLPLAVLAGIGALLGLIGFIARFSEPTLRALSTPDDYFAVLLVTLFLTTGSTALLAPAALPAFLLTSALTLLYAPLGKIRHCIY